MRYKLDKNKNLVRLSVEASFTLLDFMALFACLFLGVFFALFLWFFAFGILIKVFTKYDYEFSSDTYSLTQYLRVFSYFKFKRRVIPFDNIERFLFSNLNSGQALVERGLVNREWFTLEIIGKDKQRIRLVKALADELGELDELYLDLKEIMSDWFTFDVEYQELKSD